MSKSSCWPSTTPACFAVRLYASHQAPHHTLNNNIYFVLFPRFPMFLFKWFLLLLCSVSRPVCIGNVASHRKPLARPTSELRYVVYPQWRVPSSESWFVSGDTGLAECSSRAGFISRVIFNVTMGEEERIVNHVWGGKWRHFRPCQIQFGSHSFAYCSF